MTFLSWSFNKSYLWAIRWHDNAVYYKKQTIMCSKRFWSSLIASFSKIVLYSVASTRNMIRLGLWLCLLLLQYLFYSVLKFPFVRDTKIAYCEYSPRQHISHETHRYVCPSYDHIIVASATYVFCIGRSFFGIQHPVILLLVQVCQ